MSADRIKETVLTEGVSLPIDQETMPADLYQLLSKGLQANHEHRDIDLHEIRDVFHRIKVRAMKILTLFDNHSIQQSIEKDKDQQKTLPSKPCPTRSLSSSAIQYNHQRYLRYHSQYQYLIKQILIPTVHRQFANDQSQRNSSHSSSDYSFVSNQAKRNFLRSQPSSPSRQIGKLNVSLWIEI